VKFQSQRSDLSDFVPNTQDGTIYAATSAGRLLAIKAVYTPGKTGEMVLQEEPIDSFAAAQ
jgi:hypothetical protein